MIELAADFSFPFKPRPRANTAGKNCVRNFHGHELVLVLEVGGFKNGGHPTVIEFLDQQKPTVERVARPEFSGAGLIGRHIPAMRDGGGQDWKAEFHSSQRGRTGAVP